MQIGPRAWLAEFVGTFGLLFIGSMSAAVAFESLGGSAAGVVLAGLAHGLILAAMVYAVGGVSGAHINPAVTIGLAAIGRFPLAQVLPYIVFQLGGGIVAVFFHSWIRARGATDYGLPAPSGVTEGQAFLLEAVLTFLLVTVVVGAAVSGKGSKGFHGIAIGFTLAAAWLVGGSLTGAALNPARFFGPAVVAQNFDGQWIYWLGPVVGGLAAAVIAAIVMNLRDEPE